MAFEIEQPVDAGPSPVVEPTKPRLLGILGPGLITGASDDDPSGIATYSQAGAQFGYALTWTMLFTYPLMTAVQIVSARMGRTTGRGIAGNLRQHCPAWLLTAIVSLLLIANAINIGADLGAMADASRLVLGGPQLLYVLLFAAICIALQIFLQYTRYVSVLKWLTLFLFAYVACMFMVKVPWSEAAKESRHPLNALGHRLPDDRGCGPWHHHQPLPVLLAGLSGSRRRPYRPGTADTQAGASSG